MRKNTGRRPKSVTIAMISLVALISPFVQADVIGKGKIIYTQDHTAPACRTVLHRESATGVERNFRIAAVPGGQDDVSSILLSALIANRDVQIFYNPGQAGGCGQEPAINYVTIY